MPSSKLLNSSLLLFLAMATIAGCQKKDAADEGASANSTEVVATVHLPVTHVIKENLANLINVSGVVAALPDHSIKVSAAVAGKLISVPVVPGQKVTKGQIIARLDNRSLTDAYKQTLAALNTTKAGVDQANTNLQLAKSTAERTKRLVELNIAAQKDLVLAESQVQTATAQVAAAKSQVDQAKSTRGAAFTQLGFTDVKTPITGIVAQRFLNVGDTADSATPIVQIVDLDTVIVTAYIPVVLPTRILPGYTAAVKSASMPNQKFHGTVTSISPVVDQQTSNILVQIRCSNPGNELKEGMPVTVAITTGVHNDALVVPSTALVADPEAPDSRMVYVVQNHEMKRAKVKTGIERDGMTEIVSGLSANAVVVAKGAYGLPDGTKIEAESDQVHKTSAVTISGN
jgi:RND family efflux transporter MFP subunit